MNFRGLRRAEAVLLVVILVQSLAIIVVYEGLLSWPPSSLSFIADDDDDERPTTPTGIHDRAVVVVAVANNAINDDNAMMMTATASSSPPQQQENVEKIVALGDEISSNMHRRADDLLESNVVHHLHPNTNPSPGPGPGPGGLILSACFSYMQDPREVHRKIPLPHILPTFENIYHYHTTANHHRLDAIIFHDDMSFNSSFVRRHESDHVKFVRVEPPTFLHGEPVISPNDFRYVVFDRWLEANTSKKKQSSSSSGSGSGSGGDNDNDDNGGGRSILVNGIEYGWIMIADLDMAFQRNPFPKLDDYARRQNLTFFGSWDGGTWENEQMRLQRKLFRNCYGRKMLLQWNEEVEWKTPNGNCGLWAGRFREVKCILNCMSGEYDRPPVRGKGDKTICDMVTHDYCVHYGGCFPNSTKGVYDTKKVGVLWGEDTMGKDRDLFGPPYGRYRQCDKDSWSVMHNRCDWKGPLCYKEDAKGNLIKYHQESVKGRKCRLDPNTDLPLPG